MLIRVLLIFLVIIFSFSLDFFTKLYIRDLLQSENTNMIKINGFLNIKGACNYGVSFSLFENLSPILMKIFIGILLIVLLVYIIYIFYLYIKLHSQLINSLIVYGLSLIFGGAAANFFDRIINECVFDFIDFHFGLYHWYVFNLADAFITIGAFLVLIGYIYRDKQLKKDI